MVGAMRRNEPCLHKKNTRHKKISVLSFRILVNKTTAMKDCLLLLTACFFSLLSQAQITTGSQWTWMKGDNTANATAVYGTKGTPAPANKPGARERSVSWTDAAGNFWLFGGDGYNETAQGGLNDLWKYDRATNQWTWIKGDNTLNGTGVYGTQGVEAVANQPGARSWAASWRDASGNFWLFGGSGVAANGPGQLNDLWKYNSATDAWTWIKGDNTVNEGGSYGTQGVPAATNKPGARYASTTWTDAAGNLWLFGGRGYVLTNSPSLANLNDLWRYNPSTNQWTWVNGSNGSNDAAVYGTQGVPSAANKPGARFGSFPWRDATGNLWLFGGEVNFMISGVFNSYNDLWKYNPSTNQWAWMKGDNTANNTGVYGVQGMADGANKPGARYKGTSWTDAAGNFWLFGGQLFYTNVGGGFGPQDEYNDLWKYNPSDNNWTWVKGDITRNSYGVYGTQGSAAPDNKPGARLSHVSWTDNAGSLWLFGGSGYAAGTSGLLNDLWKLSAGANGSLPVTLLALSATPKNNVVDVAWKTSQEINTSHFVVERSADGRTFSSLGTVAAAGNGSSAKRYSFTDDRPFSGDNYYRIKMVDKDGSFVYSPVVRAALQPIKEMVVYPNPVIDNATVRVTSDGTSVLKLSLYDAGGRAIKTRQAKVTAGSNFIPLGMGGLPKGVYTAVVVWGQESRRIMVVKE